MNGVTAGLIVFLFWNRALNFDQVHYKFIPVANENVETFLKLEASTHSLQWT